ncbi:MAG: hypothetical protein RR061_05340 [Muribaculaceae bacterium]
MKKLVLLLAVVFSVSLFSCGNSAKTETATDSTATTAVVEDVVDSATVVVDSATVVATDTVAK